MPATAITLRDEAPGDHAAIRALLVAAFGQPDEADLVERLRADEAVAFALVAEDEGAICGHIMFPKLSAPFRALALAPVAVEPARQNAGIGGALIRAGLARARDEGWQGVFVLGEPDYYTRFGFDAGLAGGFECVYAGPYLMAQGLGWELPVMSGVIGYPRAFDPEQ